MIDKDWWKQNFLIFDAAVPPAVDTGATSSWINLHKKVVETHTDSHFILPPAANEWMHQHRAELYPKWRPNPILYIPVKLNY